MQAKLQQARIRRNQSKGIIDTTLIQAHLFRKRTMAAITLSG
jgi:hypothetical protein